ncbi:hypothetical protein HU200_052149 [Digitaria exilis]|uniref:DUF6598 domain-containing protein n=1 Tax=Digitaria exilis TaxID=1010633 RepID=A0A835AUH8_9POAL|nr:hypothetical protein HU200_052149 [Digitaria exilis]CAB3455154.1 unnamed protein product [Digitaria exilis]
MEEEKSVLPEAAAISGPQGQKRAQVEDAGSLPLEKANAVVDRRLEKTKADKHEPLFSTFGYNTYDIFGIDDDNDDAEWAAWQAALSKALFIPEVKEEEESIEEWEKRMWARRGDQDEDLSDDDDDDEARRASRFRADWEFLWSPRYGAFDDNTRIPSMRYTFSKPPQANVMHENALQIFSAKVTSTKVDFPFHVFGMVAMRDCIDHNRNVVFCRTRDNCQTLTEEHPYLVLTGPTRAAMLEMSTPVTIEVDLMLKGTTDSDDQKLSSLAVPVISDDTMYSHMWKSGYTSKLSTIEFTLGHIICSVEATIFVQVTHGSWPDGFRGQFSVVASGVRAHHDASTIYHTSVNDKEFVLLNSGGDKVHVTGNGDVKLSRRVVSVDTTGELKVYVKAWGADGSFTNKWVNFKPSDAGKGEATIDMGFCTMDVTVFWSLISYHHVFAKSAL